jgi:hypothetical protein
MKNIFKAFGIIAIVAVIGFSMAACSSGDDGITTVPVTGITLNQKSISMTVGGTATLTATVTPDNATNKAFTWSSSDTAKATVSNGVVTAVAEGTATIKVTTTDGSKTDTCTVTVTPAGSSSAVLDHITAVYIGVEAIFPDTTLHTLKDDLTVKAHYSDNTETTLEMEDYELSGTLTVGSSIITVSYQSKITTFTVTVHAPHSHNWGNWETITQATCSEEGEESRHCTADPPHSETRPLPIDLINGHDYQWQATTPATFTSEGVEKEICTHDATHTRGTRPIPQIPFTSIADLGTWLTSQPENNASTPYTVKLNVSDLGGSSDTAGSAGYLLSYLSPYKKYVSLDLSGSTFTSIPYDAVKDRGAFETCAYLTSVTIGSSVTNIGDYAFVSCYNLTAINVVAGNSAYTAENGVLYNKAKTVLIQYPVRKTDTSFIIPNSVTNIGECAFFECENLTSVTIPASVTSIGDQAFGFCENLTSVTFATGSNISNANFGNNAFFEGSGYNGDLLKTAYNNATTKAGTYRYIAYRTWSKQ